MKANYSFFITVILLFPLHLIAQISICLGESVILNVENMPTTSQTIQWQESQNGIDWTDISVQNDVSCSLSPIISTYYRVWVNDSLCDLPEYYSDEKLVEVKPLPHIDQFDDVISCYSYTLPDITNGQFFYESMGMNQATTGTIFTHDTILYIYNELNGCHIEDTIQLTVSNTCPITYILDMIEFVGGGGIIGTNGVSIAGNFSAAGVSIPNWDPVSMTQISQYKWNIPVFYPPSSAGITQQYKFLTTST